MVVRSTMGVGLVLAALLALGRLALPAVLHLPELTEQELSFSFCSPLQSSRFIFEKGNQESLAKAIDCKAYDIFSLAKLEGPTLVKPTLMRLSCFTATLPEENRDLPISQLEHLPTSYFPFLPFSKHSQKVKDLKKSFDCKKNFKIAYLIMAHKDFDNIIVFIFTYFNDSIFIMFCMIRTFSFSSISTQNTPCYSRNYKIGLAMTNMFLIDVTMR
jgi:hypothetical protein